MLKKTQKSAKLLQGNLDLKMATFPLFDKRLYFVVKQGKKISTFCGLKIFEGVGNTDAQLPIGNVISKNNRYCHHTEPLAECSIGRCPCFLLSSRWEKREVQL
jgi:hypothetical protein